MWVQLPLVAAKKAVVDGFIQIGWFRVKVEMLEQRPFHYFRCLKKGSVRANCPCDVDRSGRCFRCGAKNHNAKDCTERPKRPLCTDLKRKADHILGGAKCAPKRSIGQLRKINVDAGARTGEQVAIGTTPSVLEVVPHTTPTDVQTPPTVDKATTTSPTAQVADRDVVVPIEVEPLSPPSPPLPRSLPCRRNNNLGCL